MFSSIVLDVNQLGAPEGSDRTVIMTTASKTNGRVETLEQRHAALVKTVESLRGAELATARRRIGDLEYECEVAGTPIATPYEPPPNYTRKWDLSETDLRSRLVTARELAADETKRPMIRDRAEKDVAKLEAQMTKRNLT
jgi:hypothetical protein